MYEVVGNDGESTGMFENMLDAWREFFPRATGTRLVQYDTEQEIVSAEWEMSDIEVIMLQGTPMDDLHRMNTEFEYLTGRKMW